MADGAIRVRGLTKSYAGQAAVRGIDLDVGRGEVFALLGPNGAGKTTTIEILEGFRRRDSGEVSVLGYDPIRQATQMKRQIGVVFQETSLDQYLSVREILGRYARLYPHPRRVDEVIELFGLTAKRDTRVLRLSGGQQRRLDMAVALVGDPELLFLDEPTTGFDPSARRDAWNVVKSLAALGKTIVLTTHYMDEAQALADRVAVISQGEIVAEGPPSTLGRRDASQARVVFSLPADVLPPVELGARHLDTGRYEIVAGDVVPLMSKLTEWALHRDVELSGLEVLRPSLEDVYLELTTEAGQL